MIGSDELVEETTTSAWSSSDPSRSNGTACASNASASLAAFACVRLVTAPIVAPRAASARAASSLTSPAPTSSTRQPVRSPNTCWASAAAADETDAGLSLIAVSVRTFLPTRSASRNNRSSTGPCAPASYASRTWPRISPSPGTSESRPAATRNRCSAAASSVIR